MLQTVITNVATPPENESILTNPLAYTQQANAAASDPVQMQMIQLLLQIQQDLKICITSNTNRGNNN